MQIFSKLQRNSSNQIFIKLLLVYFVNFFGSFTPFFPLMLGVFILCEEFFVSLFFVILFSYLHNFNILYFAGVLLFNKFVILNRLKDIVDFHYQDAVSLIVIYLFLGLYLYLYANTGTFLLTVYLIYNYAFDLIIVRLLKCELKSY